MSSPIVAAEEADLSKSQMVWYSIAVCILVLGAGFFIGLQIALFSIDRLFLRVLVNTGTTKERRQATCLLEVLALQHWTLVALVLMNAIFCMSLPLLLERMFDELTALIVSITAVLFLGEVVPLAVFVRWAIPVCSFFIRAIWLAIIITAPISYPVGKLLDRLLGNHDEILDRDDLTALIVGTQMDDGAATETPEDGHLASSASGSGAATSISRALDTTQEQNSASFHLNESEVQMLQAAMLLSTDTVDDHLRTRTEMAFMLSSRDSLNRETILRILTAGFSRIPVYFGDDKRHVIGVLIANSLVSLCFTNPDPPPSVSDYPLREVIRLSVESSLYDAYLAFRNGISNMAIIYNSSGVMVGLLTLNDVLATLYHADPVAPISLTDHFLRRQHRMAELVEGMRYLNKKSIVRRLSSSSDGKGGHVILSVHAGVPPASCSPNLGDALPQPTQREEDARASIGSVSFDADESLPNTPRSSSIRFGVVARADILKFSLSQQHDRKP